MSTTTSSRNTAEALLDEACARNTTLELHYEGPNAGLIVGRTRALELCTDVILADVPVYKQGEGPIPVHRSISVHLTLNKTQYSFRSAIKTFGVRVRLNDRKDVFGIALRRPNTVTQLQRRAHYRMSLAASDPVSVDMARCCPDVPEACPIDGRVGTSSMVNLSTRGVALLIARRVLRNVKPGDRFYLTFTLPGVDDEFCMLATARHTFLVERSNSLKVGFAFVSWAGQNFDRCQAEITRFIAGLERRMLRRKR